MALKGHAGIHRRHAASVVDYLDEGASGVLYVYLDYCRSGVDGIFHQFLYHGGGPLDYLSGRNLVCHRVGQQLHYIFHRELLFPSYT